MPSSAHALAPHGLSPGRPSFPGKLPVPRARGLTLAPWTQNPAVTPAHLIAALVRRRSKAWQARRLRLAGVWLQRHPAPTSLCFLQPLMLLTLADTPLNWSSCRPCEQAASAGGSPGRKADWEGLQTTAAHACWHHLPPVASEPPQNAAGEGSCPTGSGLTDRRPRQSHSWALGTGALPRVRHLR